MTIGALLIGKLYAKPEQRMGKSGRPFTTAKLRTAAGDGEGVLFVNVVAFDESAHAVLLTLEAGDAAALAGSLTLKVWTDREGTARPSVDLVADQMLSVYGLKRKRATIEAAAERAAPAPASKQAQQRQQPQRDDAGGAWLDGGDRMNLKE